MRSAASKIQIQFLKCFASLRPLFYRRVVGFNNFEKKKELESIVYDRVLAAGHPPSLTDLARQGFLLVALFLPEVYEVLRDTYFGFS